MRTDSTSVLRWTFTRNYAAVTCEVDAGAGKYEVALIPHWDVSRAAIERFDTAVTALERHAELSAYLRERGWSLADRGTGGSRHAA